MINVKRREAIKNGTALLTRLGALCMCSSWSFHWYASWYGQ